jgi:hypothetical protein
VRFLIDSTLPPHVADPLNERGHDAVTPSLLGAHNLPDDVLIELATTQRRVIVTENASDFAYVTNCPVLLVRKSWWPSHVLVSCLAAAIDRWARATPDPGPWAHWLESELQ